MPGLEIRLPRARRVGPDVVAGDAVRPRERAGADRRVGARGDRGERAGEGVAVVRAAAHQPLQVGPVVRPVPQHVPAAAVVDERHHDLRRLPGRLQAGEHPPVAVRSVGRRLPVEPDQPGGGRRQIRERHPLLGVARLHDAGAVHDERDPLEVHPDRRVARPRVLRHQRERFVRVVRAVERRHQELDVAGAAGAERPLDQLHVLGAEPRGRLVLDRGAVGTGELRGRASDRGAAGDPDETAEAGEREEPAARRIVVPAQQLPLRRPPGQQERREPHGQARRDAERDAPEQGHPERDEAAQQGEDDQGTRCGRTGHSKAIVAERGPVRPC